MPWKTPQALARIAVVPVLTVALASCGGGSTAEPSAIATAAAPAATQAAAAQAATTTAPPAPAATQPATTAPAPSATPPASQARAQGTGGASAPAAGATEPSTASAAPAAATDEPAPTDDAQPAPSQQATEGSPLDERADLILTERVSPSHYFQQGTVTGTYDGTMEVEARITSKGVLVRFTATLPGGTISGRGVAIAILDSTTWPGLRGTAIVTGGTGRFAGIHGRRLSVSGRAKPDASKAHVRLTGTVLF